VRVRTSTDRIVVLVPARAARAVIEAGSVKEFVAAPGALFGPALGEQMLDTLSGTLLKIAKPPRLVRMPAGEASFGAEDHAIWVADFTQFKCGHEGLGCDLVDGARLPHIRIAGEKFEKFPVAAAVMARRRKPT
jgi:hypothetical protein